MTRGKRIIRTALAILAGLVALTTLGVGAGMVASAVGLRGGNAAPAKPSVAPPTTTTFDQGEWTIRTPAGWTRQNVTRSADAVKAVRYSGPNGEYFVVAIDPMGSDYTYDALWTYEVAGKGFRVVSRHECAGTDEACSDSDGRYDGYLMWKTGSVPAKLGGHVWYFMFGNTTSTTIEAGVFESIAESVRAK